MSDVNCAEKIRAVTDRIGDQYKLPAREKEVFYFLVRGLSNLEIAKCLWIDQKTVKNHVSRILQRTSKESRYQLQALVLEDIVVKQEEENG